jgi:hypothetical protein
VEQQCADVGYRTVRNCAVTLRVVVPSRAAALRSIQVARDAIASVKHCGRTSVQYTRNSGGRLADVRRPYRHIP